MIARPKPCGPSLRIGLTSGIRSCIATRISHVRSELPSSTGMISCGTCWRRNSRCRCSIVDAMHHSSSRAGMTTDISFSSGALLAALASAIGQFEPGRVFLGMQSNLFENLFQRSNWLPIPFLRRPGWNQGQATARRIAARLDRTRQRVRRNVSRTTPRAARVTCFAPVHRSRAPPAAPVLLVCICCSRRGSKSRGCRQSRT